MFAGTSPSRIAKKKWFRNQKIAIAIRNLEPVNEELISADQELQKRNGLHLEQCKEILYRLPVGIYTCNAEGYIELYNEAAVRLWGRAPEAGKEMWCGSWKIYNTDGTLLPHD